MYTIFSGRASRSECWWWALVSAVVGVLLNIIVGAGSTATTSTGLSSSPGPGAAFGFILVGIWSLATIPPCAITPGRFQR
ncbi:DUF805 domain-containing protein [Arthrobacter sp. B3I9]|uniref:DUF805 domain-containing protein n=1 Tax=Arthrobacter sp. B3I9 TaxID=3042270 RepID=UPI0027D83237|nr:DUF805 domain-containing protein [Arthrobacter sp. B3I9]